MLNERLLRALEQVAPGQPSALHFVQCSSALPTGALPERSVWRDRRLMALAAQKRRAAEQIGE